MTNKLCTFFIHADSKIGIAFHSSPKYPFTQLRKFETDLFSTRGASPSLRSIVNLIDDGTTEAQRRKISSTVSIGRWDNLNRLADLNVLMLGMLVWEWKILKLMNQ